MQIKNVNSEASLKYNAERIKSTDQLNKNTNQIKSHMTSKEVEEKGGQKQGLLTKDSLKEKLVVATEELKEVVNIFNRKIDFSVHDDTKRIMVKVVDSESGDVLREIPPEEMLDLVAKMQKTLGLLVDEKA